MRQETEEDARRRGAESPMCAGVQSPEAKKYSAGGLAAVTLQESDRTEEKPCEGEVESASHAVDEQKLSSRSAGRSLAKSCTSRPPSLNDSPQVGSQVATDAWIPTCPAIVMNAEPESPSGEKRCVFRDLVGVNLGACGVGLLQLALEVLPTSRAQLKAALTIEDDQVVTWMICVVISLNSYWGCELFFDGDPNEVQCKCLETILKDVTYFSSLPSVIPALTWDDFFKVKSIDYKGDEVQVAKWFQWSNVEPALPKEVGSVPLSEVCTLGCQHYVNNFEQYLKPALEWGTVMSPRVMVEDRYWGEVCTGLVTSGVCTFIAEEDVFHTQHGPLLNGLFCVSKNEWLDNGTEIFRLIMNLTPLNALCEPIDGDVNTLPAWSSMNPFFLQPDESLLVSSEDVRCFFYTMGVPVEWTKFLAFNKEVPGDLVPEEMKGQRVFLASRVLPMGFVNSVSLAQHVHRNLVAWGEDPLQPSNRPEP